MSEGVLASVESGSGDALLLLGCSATKKRGIQPMSAIDRYDGVNFRVVRKLRREGRWPRKVRLRILSAKYGLLMPEDEINNYELRITPIRAEELRGAVLSRLGKDLPAASEVFVNLGKAYLAACSGLTDVWDPPPRVVEASGAIGMRMAQMKSWLVEKHRLEVIGSESDSP